MKKNDPLSIMDRIASRISKDISAKISELLTPNPFEKGFNKAIERVCEEIAVEVLSKEDGLSQKIRETLRKDFMQYLEEEFVVGDRLRLRGSKRTPEA